ncbi:MAG: hypothetical protein V2I76_01460 [Roseobacter sp.]|jgi:hypothetical protein|nr:hypothetical protein [Roseobacter sp.]
MKRFYITLATTVVLGACTTVSDETRTEAFVEGGLYDGERYEIRQRFVEGPTGEFQQTSVVYRGFARTCIADSPNDCALAAESLIEEYDEEFF